MTINHIPNSSITKKIVKNTVYNLGGKIWFLAVGILITPYIISRIGVDRFGVWAIVGIITGYFGLLDFGIGASYVKYIAEFNTKREMGKINNLINTGFTLYFMLAVISTLVVFFFRTQILSLLNVPQNLRYDAGVVLLIGITLFGASNAMSSFGAVQGGLQRMDISNNIGVALSIVNIAGTVFFLERGFGIIGLMINNVIIFILSTIASVIVAYRLMPELRFRIFTFDKAIFGKMFTFGYNMQIGKISGMIANQTDKILITCFLSIGLVTFYQLGSLIVYNAATFANILSSALMPAFAEIEARGERLRLIEAYIRSVRYASFLVAPIFILLAITGPQIIYIWMGRGFYQSGEIIRILSFAFLINTIALVPASICLAINKPQLLAAGSVITIVMNLALSTLFVYTFGFFGAAWGTLIAVNIGTLYFLRKLHREIEVRFMTFVWAVAPSVLSGIAATGILFAVWSAFTHHNIFLNSGRIESLLLFFVKALIFAAAYLAASHFLAPFKTEEMKIIKEKIPFLGPIIVRIITRS